MVAAIGGDRRPPEPKSSGVGDLPAPHHRPPLTPSSERDNAASRAPPRRKEITSRYLSSYASSSPPPSSTSTTTSGSSFSSSSSAMSSRRFPSPLATSRASALPQAAAQKRSHSANRARPQPTPDPRPPPSAEPSAASRALCMTTRSLSVSFQGESFFYQTSRAKASPSTPARKHTPERRRLSAVGTASPARAPEHSENSRPLENHHHNLLWPAAARAGVANSFIRSLDCSSDMTEPVLATVKLLNQSMAFDCGTRRATFDGVDLSVSSDSESVSSESNSGTPDFNAVSSAAKASPRGICVTARFLQGTYSPLRRFPEENSPLSSSGPRTPDQSKMGLLKKLSLHSPSSSPRSASSPLRGPIRQPSPSKVAAQPARGMLSPLRARTSASVETTPVGQSVNAPSIISFAAEVRRAKKGENRIEEAHMLRLFDNRHLQWRCINARVNAILSQQKSTAEESLYTAWITAENLRDSVTIKRIKLQILTQSLKLTSILKAQMRYLEEWSLIEREHSNSLSAATEALKASILRLPVGGGAKAEIQKVKDVVSSAVDVMQAMAFSICCLSTKVEGTNSLLEEITKVSTQERALLNQSRDLLSTVAAMHVTMCSLQGHAIQLKRKPSLMQI